MKKEIGRREFLKIVLGSAAAAGLSHFRFLNVGGAAPVSAGDQCGLLQSADGYCYPDPDACLATDPDGRDTCWPQDGDPDLCTTGEVDVCMPADDTDECVGSGDPDNACAISQTDTCSARDPDLCWPDHDPDACVPQGDEDIYAPEADPDECGAQGDPDYNCTDPYTEECSEADPDLCAPCGDCDVCVTPGDPDYGTCSGPAEDVCIPGSDPDLCYPPQDPDERVWQASREEFVPEPGSMGLLASGLLGLAGYAALRLRSLRPRSGEAGQALRWMGKDEEEE